MNLFKNIESEIIAVIEDLAGEGALPSGLDTAPVTAEPPREAGHGDVATNAALVLARQAAMNPRDLAGLLAQRLGAQASVTSAEVAGPGFVNLRLDDHFWRARLVDVLEAGLAYGDSDIGKGIKVNVEYVSANPTGPLHVGHGRGAVVGDALASLLQKAGFKVVREYYVNDAGAQVDALARSVRLIQEDKKRVTIPEGGYPGEFTANIAVAITYAGLDRPEDEWLDPVRREAVDYVMERIRNDLDALGIRIDLYTSERQLVADGKVDKALKLLEDRGLIYTGVLEPPKGKTPEDWEPRPQTLFRATKFGDDVDRPLRKSDGSWTYFAADIAYHLDKFDRGFAHMIDVWGADHAGYVKRLAAAVKAITEGKGELDVKICQLVNLLEGGKPVRMSKRAGDFVTLREVVERVGKDVVRFIMLTRKNDAPLDFDLAKVTEQSRDNPVFYVQYAHARACSVLRHAQAEFPGLDVSPEALARGPLQRLTHEAELALIKLLATWPRQVENAAEAHEPHRIAFYLSELAAAFHGLWNKGNTDAGLRFLVPGDEALTAARLALVRGVALVIASGLEVLGVEPVEEMR